MIGLYEFVLDRYLDQLATEHAINSTTLTERTNSLPLHVDLSYKNWFFFRPQRRRLKVSGKEGEEEKNGKKQRSHADKNRI